MIESVQYIKSDLYKLKHSALFWLHLILPICGTSLMLLYSMLTHISIENKVAAFFQIFAIAYPFVIGIVCSIISEQEILAGNCQNILTLPCRRKVISAKLFILLVFGLFSMVFSSVLFYLLLPIVGIEIELPFLSVLIPTLVLWGSNIVFYILSLLLAFGFGKNVCIGIGVLGSLLTALMQTGLGTGLWYVMPYGIGIRLTEYSFISSINIPMEINKEIEIAIICDIIITMVLLITLIAWFSHYSGKRAAE